MVAAQTKDKGLGEAPWPPHYPKMPGEPPRGQPLGHEGRKTGTDD